MSTTKTRAIADVEQAVARYGPALQRLAYVYQKNIHDVEDAAQDVFLAYLRSTADFPTEEQRRAWLMTVTANRCRSLLRRFLRLHRLTILLRLATQDAARCALLTGSLRGVAAFLPPDFRRRACIRIQPDFFSSRSSW